jgi:hypothetical protein
MTYFVEWFQHTILLVESWNSTKSNASYLNLQNISSYTTIVNNRLLTNICHDSAQIIDMMDEELVLSLMAGF